MRARNQPKLEPGATVNGSPGICQPPIAPSNSPYGRSGTGAPRRGESVRPGKHPRVACRIPERAGLEQCHLRARLAEDLGRHPPARSGADDAGVKNLRSLGGLHPGPSPPSARHPGVRSCISTFSAHVHPAAVQIQDLTPRGSGNRRRRQPSNSLGILPIDLTVC